MKIGEESGITRILTDYIPVLLPIFVIIFLIGMNQVDI